MEKKCKKAKWLSEEALQYRQIGSTCQSSWLGIWGTFFISFDFEMLRIEEVNLVII